MTPSPPYTYIQCPCSDRSAADGSDASLDDADDADERTFDPRAPRANYSLFPLEYLLYCEDCQQIRCPRCVKEETVTYFCPNCLFEVPSSNIRGEGNRCTRSCYQCPVCIGPLQTSAVTPRAADDGEAEAGAAPCALFCTHCNWSSRETGIELDRPGGIHAQLARLGNGGRAKITARDREKRRKDNPDEPPLPDELVDGDLQFASLKAFYARQMAEASAGLGAVSLHDAAGFSSPAALSRIMSLYTGRGHAGRPHPRRPDVFREALSTDEGLKLAQLDDSPLVGKLTRDGWHATSSREQREAQPEPVRFQDQLRPIPCLLRTKRSKRCSVCRHIISKPESKVTSTRFRIRLVAKSYIPTVAIRPMVPTAAVVPITSRPARADEAALAPCRPHQYVLTFTNPLFEAIKVTLATPNATPGRFSSRVTILCPQFDVDANTDMWDDALRDDGRDRTTRKGDDATPAAAAEAGKIWERGRNWVSIVLEVVPPSLRPDNRTAGSGGVVDRSPVKAGEDILEIPMFVRIEWEADAQHDVTKDKDARERRELAYWCVLGVGRISHE
ncbi:dynactin subunit [Drechmeria coniospora]|uniref:Dynactin subunit 4 n=1 Tax=Drechmeria coniospora TaxID=98403 RepID=A0A151GHC5_DRECN|nr:dynactin subunit [Drechmeria coniospora]KYK56486.1 dynactin subunit [Drechmeria coniospora]